MLYLCFYLKYVVNLFQNMSTQLNVLIYQTLPNIYFGSKSLFLLYLNIYLELFYYVSE